VCVCVVVERRPNKEKKTEKNTTTERAAAL